MSSPADRDEVAAPHPGPPLARALRTSIVDGLYTVDAHGRVTSVNATAERLLGWSEAALRGRDAHETLHYQHEDGQRYPREDCPLLEVLSTGRAVQVHEDALTRADGRVLEVAYSSSPIVQDGEVTGAVIVFRDMGTARDGERRARQLADERERASAEWQRNLLPARLPDIAGVDLAVSFRPAGGDSALVGGDFYDVIAAPGGHLIVLGDVRGKGAGAAAIAAMLRYVLRGAGQASADIGALLALLNRELLAHPASRFATMVIACIRDEGDGRHTARVVSAGHPKPVLVAPDGTAREVGAGGPLLGVFDDIHVEPEEVELQPGEALVLFSDGLTDVGRRLGRDGFDVLAALQGSTVGSSSEIITRLEQAAQVPDIAERPDDVCVLAARVTPDSQNAMNGLAGGRSASPDPVIVGEVEAAFREGNERLVAGRPATEQTVTITCECGHPDCQQLLDVPRALYEQIRSEDREFLVLPGHDLPHAEHVRDRQPSYVVVRKHGAAGEAAEQAAS